MINYFDLGLLHGNEIQMFIDSVGGKDYRVHGFEAHPQYYRECQFRFKENIKVNIYNTAISNKFGVANFYTEPTGEGSSLFHDKYNVTEDYITVLTINFAEWFMDMVECKQISKTDINILRFNIEGSELDLIESLIKLKITDYINCYLGATPGEDLLKVKSLKAKYDYYLWLLKKYKIDILPFCDAYRNPKSRIKNIDLKKCLN